LLADETPRHQATTPVDPRVLDKMLPFFTNQYGNPHSRTHAYGWEAELAVDEARAVRTPLFTVPARGLVFYSFTDAFHLCAYQHVAKIIGAHAKDIVFTSGATESNNMIVKGIAKFYGSKRNHIVTTQTVSWFAILCLVVHKN
jgi:cysteine desulfurase